MTLPLQTWRVSASYAISTSTTATPAEILAGVNALLVAETAVGGLWGVSNFNAGNGTLEIKRNGTPAGTLATFRALMFGGQTPHTSAVVNGQIANTVRVYAGVCENANTSGPASSYTTGSPYPGLKWTTAGNFCIASQYTFANGPSAFLVESDEMCCIMVNDSSGSSMFMFGACVEKLLDNTSVWSGFVSGGKISNTAFDSIGSNNPTIAHLPHYPTDSSYSDVAVGLWHNGTSPRYISRLTGIFGGGPTSSHLRDVTNGFLLPIVVGDKTLSVAQDCLFLGQVRQVRDGPLAINKSRIVDGSATVQAYAISWGGQINARPGLYFDVQQ